MSGAPPVALSIVTSMYQSAAFLDEFHERCSTAASRLGGSYEIVFVNDGSPDDSLAIALGLQRRDSHVRVVDLSRNFGHHKALMTGLAHARGERIFLLDCDLEEDPAWLITFDEMLRTTGADVVYGVQSQRKGDWFERLSGQVVFKVLNQMLEHQIPVNVVTARLMTARYVRALLEHQESELFLAGLLAATGFDQRLVLVKKGSRPGTSYTLRRRISGLVNAITSFSNRPLVYIFQAGISVMLLSIVAGVVLVYKHLTSGIGVPGWASIMVSIWFLGGLTIFCVGVIGVYLAKIFVEIKHRPRTIVRAEYGPERD